MNDSNIKIGTSGFMGIDSHTYFKLFNVVELNTTFYGIPKDKVWQKWFDNSKEYDVQYIIKVNNFFTHKKKLLIDDIFIDSWNEFWRKCNILKNKLGPIFFQLSSNFKYSEKNINKLKILFSFLPKWNYVFEFRDIKFYNKNIFDLFNKFNWCFCIIDVNNNSKWIKNMPYQKFILPELDNYVVTSNIIYIRLHGSKDQYIGKYGENGLKEIENFIKEFYHNYVIYIIFNNTDSENPPSAYSDALTLKNILLK